MLRTRNRSVLCKEGEVKIYGEEKYIKYCFAI